MKYIQGLKLLYSRFPMQFCTTYRVDVKSFKELLELLNSNNGRKRCFASVVNYNETTKGMVDLDKFVFDFDNTEKKINGVPRCLEDARALHSYLKHGNIKHIFIFSGAGIHCYIFTSKFEDVSNAKYVLKMAHEEIIEKTQIDADKHVIGDVARVMTIPGSYNVKRERYAIFLNEEDLNNSYETICKKAEKTQFTECTVYGEKLFDLAHLIQKEKEKVIIPNIKFEIKSDDRFIQSLPPCIQQMVFERGDWRSRWLFTLYCKEVLGFPLEKTKELAKKYFTKFIRSDRYLNNYNHYEQVRTAEYVYSREDVYPTCETVFKDGLCPGKCKKYNSFYLAGDKK